MSQQQNINDLLAAIHQLVEGNQAFEMTLQAAALVGGALAPLPPQPPSVVKYAEGLSLTNVDSILVYSPKQGVAIFNAECASLPTKYNLGQEG